MSIFPYEVDQSWLDYLSRFPPLSYILAQHICAKACHLYQGRECIIVYNVFLPGWVLQPVHGDPFDDDADDTSLEDIFGSDMAGIDIAYCPFCGVPLSALPDETTCLDPWHADVSVERGIG